MGRPLPYGHPAGVEPVPEEALPPGPALVTAQSLLDTGRAFAAHEILEATWKASPPAERALWQGLAQVCVAVTHAQRGNHAGAVRLAARAADRLRPYRDAAPYGIDVAGLVAWTERAALTDRPAGAAGSPSLDAPRLTGRAAAPGTGPGQAPAPAPVPTADSAAEPRTSAVTPASNQSSS